MNSRSHLYGDIHVTIRENKPDGKLSARQKRKLDLEQIKGLTHICEVQRVRSQAGNAQLGKAMRVTGGIEACEAFEHFVQSCVEAECRLERSQENEKTLLELLGAYREAFGALPTNQKIKCLHAITVNNASRLVKDADQSGKAWLIQWAARKSPFDEGCYGEHDERD